MMYRLFVWLSAHIVNAWADVVGSPIVVRCDGGMEGNKFVYKGKQYTYTKLEDLQSDRSADA